MKKAFILILAILFCPLILSSQIHQNHWETIFNPGQPTKYYTGNTTPDATWINSGYNTTADWIDGYNALGFGTTISGCQGCLIVPKTNTIYTRTFFTIKDTSMIDSLIVLIDYIDGVVAYLNGKEIFRNNCGTPNSPTTADQKANAYHFLDSYTYEYYTGFHLNKELVKSCLKNDSNLLAIELHNDENKPNDAMYYMYMYASLNKDTLVYSINEPIFPFPVKLDSSELPIVLLDVPGNYIPDAPRITASMKVIDNGKGKINHLTDQNFNYDGKITIERRGSASSMFPKHSYGFTTVDNTGKDTSVMLMGLPKENAWIFKGEFEDRSLLRDVISYDLARKTNHYAPRTQFCELFINGTHLGLFTLTEKIKRDTFRVDIAKLKSNDNSGLDVTGGYILKLDKTTGTATGGFYSTFNAPLQSIKPYFQYDYPNGNDLTTNQKDYIKKFIDDFETTLRSKNYKDPVNGYRKYISEKSFIDYMLIQEISRNVDGYRLSTFLYKEKDKDSKIGKLHMGPVWDFNLAYGYSGSLCSSSWANDGWGYDYNQDCKGDSYYIPFWWDRLLQDPTFRDDLKARWDELRKGPFNTDSIMNYINSTVAKNRTSINRNFQIWDNEFKGYVWPNNSIGSTYDDEIDYLQNFIKNRLAWIDANLPEVHEEIDYFVNSPSITTDLGQLKVYPVPFQDVLNVEFTSVANSNIKFSVYSINGQSIYSTEFRSVQGVNKLTWNGTQTNGFSVKPGVYFYTLEMNNKLVARNKILK